MAKERKEKGKIAKSFKGRVFRVGTYSTVILVFAVVLVVFVNLFAGSLPATFMKVDLTTNQLFSIGEQTEQIVSGIEEDVTIYLIAETGYEDGIIVEMLDQYKALSSHIKVEQKDPVLYPNFAAEYTDEEVYSNSLLVVSEKRSRFISYVGLYEYDDDAYYNYYYYGYDLVPSAFDGENQVTSAIDYVTTDTLPVIYALAGHGEQDLYTALQESISSENMELQSLRLLETEAIPEDASAILIHLPETDISTAEYELLLAYMQEGGNCIVIADMLEGTFSNLEALLADYGVAVVNGMVMEGNQSGYYMYPNYLLCEVGSDHTIISPLEGYYALVPGTQGLVETEDSRSTIAYYELLGTTEAAYSKVENYNTTFEKEEGDIEGPFSLMVAVEDAIDDDVSAKMVVIASPYFLDEGINTYYSVANANLFLNSLGWMTEKAESISIRSKDLSTETLVIDTGTAGVWNALFIGIIPVIILVAGGVVVFRRKKR